MEHEITTIEILHDKEEMALKEEKRERDKERKSSDDFIYM